MSAAAGERAWLIGRRFVDDGQEYVVMKVGLKRWKNKVHDVAFYSEPDKVADAEKWEWSLSWEVEAMVGKNPLIDKKFHTTLSKRAVDLDTHPLTHLKVDSSEFWSKYDDGDKDKANAKAAEKFFTEHRSSPYLNGVLDGIMHSALFALAEIGCAVQGALLFKPVRKGASHDKIAF